MILLLDIGNTLCKWALLDEKQIVEKGFTVIFDACFIESLQAKGKMFNRIILSSVRTISESLEDYLRTHFDYQRVETTMTLPLKIAYETPETLGIDRVMAAVGASALFPGLPLLIIDAGTAITIDFVSSNKSFLGGNIAPGMRLRFQALHDFTDKLPLVSQKIDFNSMGTTTESAIRAGVQQGVCNELESYVAKARKQHENLQVVLTGGDSLFLSKIIEEKMHLVEDLVFIGMQQLV
ncbi:MAG: type III pantothenate kinase [Mangrovibacterium sp.]